MKEYKLVPVEDIERLERARKYLMKEFITNNAETEMEERQLLAQLRRVSGRMHQITHRKYKSNLIFRIVHLVNRIKIKIKRLFRWN